MSSNVCVCFIRNMNPHFWWKSCQFSNVYPWSFTVNLPDSCDFEKRNREHIIKNIKDIDVKSPVHLGIF